MIGIWVVLWMSIPAIIHAQPGGERTPAIPNRPNAQVTPSAMNNRQDAILLTATAAVEQLQQAQLTATAVSERFRATANDNNVDFPLTVTKASENIQATANAATGANQNIRVTAIDPQARANAIRETAAAMTTNELRSNEDIQATAQALREQLPETLQNLTGDEVETLIDQITENGAIVVDEDAQTVSVTYAISETAANEALDAALVTADYSASAASVDFIAEGALVTIEDITITENLSGRLIALVSISAVDGRLTITLVYATINDIPLSESAVAEISAVIASSMDQALSLYADVIYNFTVTDAFTTDSDMVITLLIPFNIAG